MAVSAINLASDSLSRECIERAALEAAITVAVKRSGPTCEPFVGVVVERIAQKSSKETNWTIKGVKFGRSEREQCNAALSVIIKRLRREFEIAD